MQSWINTGRTITTNNYVSSAELAEYLESVQNILVGTVRHHRRNIPEEGILSIHQYFASIAS